MDTIIAAVAFLLDNAKFDTEFQNDQAREHAEKVKALKGRLFVGEITPVKVPDEFGGTSRT